MKKLNFFLMIMLMSLCVFPTTMLANEKNPAAKEVPAAVQLKLDRLEEIKEMDKSDMSRAEKKELRNSKTHQRKNGNNRKVRSKIRRTLK